MKITLYNTCPDKFNKKLKKIRKDLSHQASFHGKTYKEKVIEEEIPHPKVCYLINDTRAGINYGPRKKAACKTCEHWNNALGRRFSDLTMIISLEETQ